MISQPESKKAQSNYMLRYIIISIFFVVLIIFSYKILTGFKEEQRQAISIELKEKIKAAIEVISTNKGTRDEGLFGVPSGTDWVCFVDTSKRQELLKNPFLDKYILIKESIASFSKENMFIIKGSEVVSSEYIGEICLDDYPYYICKETKNDLLNILLEGKGTCASIVEEFVSCIIAESNKNTWQIISAGKAKLSIEPYTVITPANLYLCIEPVYMDISGALSEAYNLTPSKASFSKDAEITIEFEKDLMPDKTSISNLRIRYFDNSIWKDLIIKEASYETGKITSFISSLAPVAVFSSDAPTAVITGLFDNQIFGVNEEIVFDGSLSYDPNDNIDSYEWNFGDNTFSYEESTTHKYSEPGYYPAKLKVTDKEGNFNALQVTLIILSNNVKDDIKYQNNPLFIISENEGWQELLRVIPVVMWNNKEGVRMEYPYLIDYENQATKDDFLNPLSKYNYVDLVAFKTIPGALEGEAKLGEYFGYWMYYEDVVLVGSSNKDEALVASLFASFINAPVIFVDSSTISSYDCHIKNKKAYVIGYVDTAVESFLVNNAKSIVHYSLDNIKNPVINPYAALHSEIMPSIFFD